MIASLQFKSRFAVVQKVLFYGLVELMSKDESIFQANGQHLKGYYEEEDRDVEVIALGE